MSKTLKERVLDFIGEENLEFIHHSKNYLSGTVVKSIVMAASIPAFTYLMTPEEFGIASVFIKTAAFFVFLFGLNINSGIIRYYLEKRNDFGQALSTNLIFIYSFMSLPFLTVILFREQIAAFVKLDAQLILLAAILAVLLVSVEIFMAYLNASQQSRKYAILDMCRSAGAVALSMGLMLWMKDNRYLGRIYGELLVIALIGLFAFWSLLRIAKASFNLKYIRYTLGFSLPLIPHAVSRIMMGYFDQVIIGQLTNAASRGLYAWAYDVGMAMSLVGLSMNRAWRPIFFDEYRQENYAKIARMVKHYANTVYIIALCIVLFAKDVLFILAAKEFHSTSHLIPIIVLGYVFVFLYLLFFQYSAFKKRTELISIASVIAVFANIGLNYWLIPIFGFEIAAYTTLVTYGLLFLLHYANSRLILKAKTIPLKNVMPNFFLLSGMTALTVYLDKTIESYLLFFVIRLAMLALGLTYYIKTKNSKEGK